MTPQISLDTLNKASQGEFVAALGGIFEHSPWIAETVATQRPFPSLGALYDAMKKAVNASGDDRKLALIKAHPDLAGKAAQAGTMTDESKSEQGSIGLDRLSPAEFQRFQTLNAAYAEKFHFPFIACVRRHTKESIFEAFETRLKNDRQQEYATALMEIFRIAGLRLDQLVAAPDKLTIA